MGTALVLADCGGNDNPNPLPTTTITEVTNYTIGGTITGLSVAGVVLANGSATVSIPAGSTTWEFPTTFAPGSSYSVTVQTQPVGETCQITGGATGMNTGDVDNVTVVCAFGQWTWKAGATTVNATGVYGTVGTAAAGNEPGGRYGATSWTDSSGNFWLFGGIGYDSTGKAGYLDDLWRYSPGAGQWTWVGGGNTANATGTYGTQGTAAAGNLPGARYSASYWTDASGNLWLFGGIGYDSTGAVGDLNDLWRFNISTGQWTWVGGANTANSGGTYGTLGTAAAGNVPGARYATSHWIDSSGNLWLFGGVGYNAAGTSGNLNDLWKFVPSTGQWTWVNGGNGSNSTGNYGTELTAAASNVPGSRYSATSWIDGTGNLWMFGGYGYDSFGTVGKLNDLWEYAPSSGQWTWISGEDAANANAIYGPLGLAEDNVLPGSRQAATSWVDSAGNFWLFGGVGFDSAGAVGSLDDLWEFDPTTRLWTWSSGANTVNASGIYGTEGSAATSNLPGGRNSVSSWIDSSGNLWVFGGNGYDSTGTLGYLNDMWAFAPPSGT